MNDITKISKSLEHSGLVIDGATEIVKHEIKKQKSGFLGAMMARMTASLITSMVSSSIQHVASSLINAINGNRVIRAGKGQEGGILLLLPLPLMMKVLKEVVTRPGEGVKRAKKVF